MALSSLALMGDMELLGRSKRKGGKIFAAIATGGASLIAARIAKKAKAKAQKRVSAQVKRQVAAMPRPVAAPVMAPVTEAPSAPVYEEPAVVAPVEEAPPVETPIEEPATDDTSIEETTEEPMSGNFAADAANEIEMMGKSAKRRKAGRVFAAIATGGLSAIGAKKRQQKAKAKLAKQTAGMAPAQKSAFLKAKKKAIHKRIGGKILAVSTGGLSTIGKRSAVRKATAHPTGKVAMRHPGLVKTTGTTRPAGGPLALMRNPANRQFPAKVTTAVQPANYSPIRASGFARTAFPAASTPSAFVGPQAVRHMSIVEYARYLFQPKYAQDYLSA
jgi:hypothetical protein